MDAQIKKLQAELKVLDQRIRESEAKANMLDGKGVQQGQQI